ncbi:MAG: class B sortase, partial [Bacillaceae bacterium]|nr:class B sortase [Bacillaceae bacterium]
LNYKDENFFSDFPMIEYETLYETFQWEIFSVYVTTTDFYYLETEFPSEEDFLFFLMSITERSLFQRDGVLITTNDEVLTLSTCDYDNTDGRFVVHARKLN